MLHRHSSRQKISIKTLIKFHYWLQHWLKTLLRIMDALGCTSVIFLFPRGLSILLIFLLWGGRCSFGENLNTIKWERSRFCRSNRHRHARSNVSCISPFVAVIVSTSQSWVRFSVSAAVLLVSETEGSQFGLLQFYDLPTGVYRVNGVCALALLLLAISFSKTLNRNVFSSLLNLGGTK